MQPLYNNALAQLFTGARTFNHWLDRPVSEQQLRELWDLAKWGPTSMNCLPMRLVFVVSDEARKQLEPALARGNVEQTMTAPVTAIVATDHAFYEKLPELFPPNPGARGRTSGKWRAFAEFFTAPWLTRADSGGQVRESLDASSCSVCCRHAGTGSLSADAGEAGAHR